MNDINTIFTIHKLAFPDEQSVAVLTDDLLKDDTAEPRISLLAYDADKPVGHILFTKASIENGDDNTLMHILAPLAVLPEYQNKGIGGKLVERGIRISRESGFNAVIVVGHPKYYPRFGFKPASNWGIKLPFEVPDEAFLAFELKENALKNCNGTVEYPKEYFDAL